MRMSSARLTGSFASLTALACLAAPEAGVAQQPRRRRAHHGARPARIRPARARTQGLACAEEDRRARRGHPARQPLRCREARSAEAPRSCSVPDSAAMAKAAVDADVVVGLTSSPGNICEPEVINPAKQLRWVFSLSAGVERCVAIPAIKERGLLVTNLRAIEGATIAEHSIAMALALARGLRQRSTSRRTKARWSRADAERPRMQTLNGKTMLVVGLGGIGAEVAERAHGIGMKVTATRNSGRTGPDYVSYVGLPDELFKLAQGCGRHRQHGAADLGDHRALRREVLREHETDGVLHQRRARTRGGHGRSRRCAQRRKDRWRRARRYGTRAAACRTSACGRRLTSSSRLTFRPGRTCPVRRGGTLFARTCGGMSRGRRCF